MLQVAYTELLTHYYSQKLAIVMSKSIISVTN